jgi:hypothetical protein
MLKTLNWNTVNFNIYGNHAHVLKKTSAWFPENISMFWRKHRRGFSETCFFCAAPMARPNAPDKCELAAWEIYINWATQLIDFHHLISPVPHPSSPLPHFLISRSPIYALPFNPSLNCLNLNLHDYKTTMMGNQLLAPRPRPGSCSHVLVKALLASSFPHISASPHHSLTVQRFSCFTINLFIHRTIPHCTLLISPSLSHRLTIICHFSVSAHVIAKRYMQ